MAKRTESGARGAPEITLSMSDGKYRVLYRQQPTMADVKDPYDVLPVFRRTIAQMNGAPYVLKAWNGDIAQEREIPNGAALSDEEILSYLKPLKEKT